ncbi:MAG: ethanolamine ammonia-lyase subunit EutB [Planctomycetaceae bacterium]|nr:ethanolamine ammonia-lyase subunit EutB [Planctomycetaceae bacterium]
MQQVPLRSFHHLTTKPICRRTFLAGALAGVSCWTASRSTAWGALAEGVRVSDAGAEDLFQYLASTQGDFDITQYRCLIGAANEFKEGDAALGVAAADDVSRANARRLLANTRIGQFTEHPVFVDTLYELIEGAVEPQARAQVAGWTFGELKSFLLTAEGPAIQRIMPGLSSDVIACVVKLMSNDELIAVGRKVFNPLPDSQIGARGYMGARVQPNSPTDHVDDIRWQVFDAWAYAVGDVLLGTNPVSSEVESVTAIELTLQEVIRTFGLEDVLPHCVLAHVDVQAEAERKTPGSTELWFQSLAGCTDANLTFDLTIDKMVDHAASRTGKYGFYFETGQGADATNGHGKGFDMVLHESRNYGFARALKRKVAEARQRAGQPGEPWVHVNDVAGFIGPEVFRSREQLVRCCLEDTVMGKLHGLTIGLDICSTLHMEVDLDDLDWCIDQVMPANPAYLMALPTKNDPMLSYLTTGYHDHVRVREKFGYKVNDRMWTFFQELGVMDENGRPTEHFGRPDWVYLQYQRRRGDERSDAQILAEAAQQMAAVRERGVFIAEGFADEIWQLDRDLDARVRFLYEDSKECLHAELPADFAATLTNAIAVATQSQDRTDYILHPPTGEVLDTASASTVEQLAAQHAERYDVQLVISDGLNALALTDPGHLDPYLARLRTELASAGFRLAPESLLVTTGRVRAGYRIGELLYADVSDKQSPRSILHVIGERPGSGHHAYSVYITKAPPSTWAQPGVTDHNITRVISGIADTALDPELAAVQTVQILKRM